MRAGGLGRGRNAHIRGGDRDWRNIVTTLVASETTRPSATRTTRRRTPARQRGGHRWHRSRQCIGRYPTHRGNLPNMFRTASDFFPFPFPFLPSLLLFSSTLRRFYPQRPSGQAVVTGVVPSSPRYVPSFLSRIEFSNPTAHRFSSDVANSRSRAFRRPTFGARKHPYECVHSVRIDLTKLITRISYQSTRDLSHPKNTYGPWHPNDIGDQSAQVHPC